MGKWVSSRLHPCSNSKMLGFSNFCCSVKLDMLHDSIWSRKIVGKKHCCIHFQPPKSWQEAVLCPDSFYDQCWEKSQFTIPHSVSNSFELFFELSSSDCDGGIGGTSNSYSMGWSWRNSSWMSNPFQTSLLELELPELLKKLDGYLRWPLLLEV